MKVLIIESGPTHHELAALLAAYEIRKHPAKEMILSIPEPVKALPELYDFKKQRGKHHGRNVGAFGKRKQT